MSRDVRVCAIALVLVSTATPPAVGGTAPQAPTAHAVREVAPTPEDVVALHHPPAEWCLSLPLYCDLLDRVLPIPAPPPGSARTWRYWATVRILGMEERFGEFVCTLRVPHAGEGVVTLNASTTLASLDGALVRTQLAGEVPDIDRLAEDAVVATVALTEKEEPRLLKLVRRLEKLRFAAVGPTAVVCDGRDLELWVDNSSGDSLFLSLTLPPRDVEQWFLDLRNLVLERVAAEPQGASSKTVSP